MEMDPIKATRPLAVITRASSGVGLELAKRFADHGYDLLITAEDPSIKEAEQALGFRGVEVESIQVDLGDYDGVEAVFRAIHRLGQPVDALSINLSNDGDPAHIQSLNDELNMLQKNVVSSVHLAKRIITDMIIRGEGSVLIGSIPPAPHPGPLDAVYAASNAFIHSFIETLKSELEGTGVSIVGLETPANEIEKDDPVEIARLGFNSLMAATEKKGPSHEKDYRNQYGESKTQPETRAI